MITVTFSNDAEQTLKQLAAREKIQPEQLIKKLISDYAKNTDFVEKKPMFENFNYCFPMPNRK